MEGSENAGPQTWSSRTILLLRIGERILGFVPRFPLTLLFEGKCQEDRDRKDTPSDHVDELQCSAASGIQAFFPVSRKTKLQLSQISSTVTPC